MVIEFILGAAIIILSMAALIVWLSDMSRGTSAIVLAAGVTTLALLVLVAHAAMGVDIVDALHLLLLVGLIAAPVIAIVFVQWRRAS